MADFIDQQNYYLMNNSYAAGFSTQRGNDSYQQESSFKKTKVPALNLSTLETHQIRRPLAKKNIFSFND